MKNLHLAIQKYILSNLPAKEAHMEYALPGHFADIVWLPRRIVIEIQTSPISLGKALQRAEDYKNMDFTLIWILHDKLYNQKYLSPAEQFFRTEQISYFTNLTPTGHGIIYNQTEHLKMRKRLHRSSPIPIDITNPPPKIRTPPIIPSPLHLYDKLLLKLLTTFAH